jgi:hypothetical protein
MREWGAGPGSALVLVTLPGKVPRFAVLVIPDFSQEVQELGVRVSRVLVVKYEGFYLFESTLEPFLHSVQGPFDLLEISVQIFEFSICHWAANGLEWNIYLQTFFKSICLDDHFLPDAIDFLDGFIFFVIFFVRVKLPSDKIICETFDKLGLDF